MANSAVETKVLKKGFIPYLDVSGTVNTENWAPQWKRIDRSTVFAYNPNPQTETLDYISYDTPITEVTRYEPSLPQEIACYKGNAVYDYLLGMLLDMPVGSACYVPCLLRMGDDSSALQIKQTTLVLGELNAVDGKISFTLNFGGDIEKGTIANTDGTPVFTKAS